MDPCVDARDLADAAGWVLARTVKAERNHPEVPLALVDGWAVSSCGDNDRFRVRGEILAGDESDLQLVGDEAVRVSTGAVVPRGTVAVLREEDCAVEGDRIRPGVDVCVGENIQRAGTEIRAGETLVRSGIVLGAEELALLAIAGIARVNVFRRPRVGILNTGTEVAPVDACSGGHQKANSNFYWLAARLAVEGGVPESLGVAADDEEQIAEMLTRDVDTDLVISTGGLGGGPADLMGNVWNRVIPEQILHSVEVRPVRKFFLGRAGSTYYVALPGAPAAVRSLYKLLLVPLLARLAGRRDLQFNARSAVLGEEVHTRHKRSTALVEGRLTWCAGRSMFWPSAGTPGGERTEAGAETAHLIIPPGEETLRCGHTGRVLV